MFHTIEEAIEDFKQGKMVIVVDDEDRRMRRFDSRRRKVTPEVINFMVTNARIGLYARNQERLDELEINQMVRNNTDNHETAFTVSVDHCSTGTGISAYERAKTVKALLDPEAKPADFRRPGHIFPLRYKEGGYCAVPATPRRLLTWRDWRGSSRPGSYVKS